MIINRTKRLMREHPLTRDLYLGLADRWVRLQIRAHEGFSKRYHSAARFDKLFSATPDPWRYAGDRLSEDRRRLILKALPRKTYRRTLEVGCAAGWISRPLAERTEHLVAADISRAALAHAAKVCEGLAHVHFVQMDIVNDVPEGQFDSIVCAGVLVFAPRQSQERIADIFVSALEPEGDLLLEHTVGDYPGEISGREIHALYRKHPGLTLMDHREVDNYAISLFRKSAS